MDFSITDLTGDRRTANAIKALEKDKGSIDILNSFTYKNSNFIVQRGDIEFLKVQHPEQYGVVAQLTPEG